MVKRPKKVADLLNKVRKCIEDGDYLYTHHASIRMVERSVIRSGVIFVLNNGWYEKSQDDYDSKYETWNYSIRGKTIDARDLRIFVSFDDSGMLIITVIDLDN